MRKAVIRLHRIHFLWSFFSYPLIGCRLPRAVCQYFTPKAWQRCDAVQISLAIQTTDVFLGFGVNRDDAVAIMMVLVGGSASCLAGENGDPDRRRLPRFAVRGNRLGCLRTRVRLDRMDADDRDRSTTTPGAIGSGPVRPSFPRDR